MGVYIGNRVAHSVMRHVGNSDPIVTVLEHRAFNRARSLYA